MGLLDDAIREHLDLKRRRGADPGEVAREQREALDAVVPGEGSGWDGDTDPVDEFVGDGALEFAPPADPPAEAHTAEAVDVEPGADFSTVGQETAELDMQAVLEEDDHPPVASSSAGPVFAGPARGISPTTPVEGDSLEWEMPARAARQPAARDAYREQSAHDDGQGTVPESWDREELPQASEGSPELAEGMPGQERLSFE